MGGNEFTVFNKKNVDLKCTKLRDFNCLNIKINLNMYEYFFVVRNYVTFIFVGTLLKEPKQSEYLAFTIRKSFWI